MTIKEAIVKYIFEMNSDMVSLILDDNKSYMDVPKELFIDKLERIFQNLKSQKINQFSKVMKGHCGGTYNNGCGGYSFITSDNQALDLLFEEENDEIKDIYGCSLFENDEKIKKKKKIYISFYEDEKTDYIPSSRNVLLQKQIETAFSEFNHFKNNVTDIEIFCNWSIHVENLYDSIDIYERINYKFTNTILKLVQGNSNIQKLITLYPLAKKAMKEYRSLNISNESELIEWVLKYENTELSFAGYEKVNNWEQNSLILHSLDNSIVIDCTKYAESLHFSKIQPKHYWELYEKYKITPQQFYTAKEKAEGFQCILETFLEEQELYQHLSIFKTNKKPIFLEYVVGKPKASDQFIEIAGIELGINVKIECIGSIYSYTDDNGVIKLKPFPELNRFELENKKANKYYIEDIGLDWKSKLQNKIMKLFTDNQVDKCPF